MSSVGSDTISSSSEVVSPTWTRVPPFLRLLTAFRQVVAIPGASAETSAPPLVISWTVLTASSASAALTVSTAPSSSAFSIVTIASDYTSIVLSSCDRVCIVFRSLLQFVVHQVDADDVGTEGVRDVDRRQPDAPTAGGGLGFPGKVPRGQGPRHSPCSSVDTNTTRPAQCRRSLGHPRTRRDTWTSGL